VCGFRDVGTKQGGAFAVQDLMVPRAGRANKQIRCPFVRRGRGEFEIG